jgi:hypothetical protein
LKKGYWWWTWSATQLAPANTNIAIAFSGWADPNKALSDSGGVVHKLPVGSKYISLGGGNSNGYFTLSSVNSITQAIQNGDFHAYDGIAYDVEEGDANLANAFTQSFAAAKLAGLKVLVTVSHSAPYGISDAADLMRYFFKESNIDILSPQLYTSGTEGSNDFTTVAGVAWSEYGNASAAIVPSLVNSGMYSDCTVFLATQGVHVAGYIQWAQV